MEVLLSGIQNVSSYGYEEYRKEDVFFKFIEYLDVLIQYILCGFLL